MHKYCYILIFSFLLGNYTSLAQKDDLSKIVVASDTIKSTMNPLWPAKAAFYSAIIPGLGQVYNKKYWKVPLVYGALGAGVYAYVWNKNKYDSYRDAYKQRLLEGDKSTDPYIGILKTSTLIDAQKQFQRQKDLSLLVTAAIYILNIIDANVDAHLRQFNINGKLTMTPDIKPNDINYKPNLGLTLNYQF